VVGVYTQKVKTAWLSEFGCKNPYVGSFSLSLHAVFKSDLLPRA